MNRRNTIIAFALLAATAVILATTGLSLFSNPGTEETHQLSLANEYSTAATNFRKIADRYNLIRPTTDSIIDYNNALTNYRDCSEKSQERLNEYASLKKQRESTLKLFTTPAIAAGLTALALGILLFITAPQKIKQ